MDTYHNLIRDTRFFLQGLQEHICFGTQEETSFDQVTIPKPLPALALPQKTRNHNDTPIPPSPINTPPIPKSIDPPQTPPPRIYKTSTPQLSIEAILKKVAPEITLKNTSSSCALLLMLDANAETLSICKALCKAIQTHLKPIKLLDGATYERENKWKHLLETTTYPLILLSGDLQAYPLLQTYRHQNLLGSSPYFVLPSSYTPEQKRALWNTLQQLLQ